MKKSGKGEQLTRSGTRPGGILLVRAIAGGHLEQPGQSRPGRRHTGVTVYSVKSGYSIPFVRGSESEYVEYY